VCRKLLEFVGTRTPSDIKNNYIEKDNIGDDGIVAYLGHLKAAVLTVLHFSYPVKYSL